MPHQAALIPSKKANLEVTTVDTPTPGPSELLVKVAVIAFSPLEWKLQKLELFPLPYPNNLGLSFAGTVESVGAEVTGFQKGDRVVTLRSGPRYADPRYGAFQQYALASTADTSAIDTSTTFAAAAACIGNLSTIVSVFAVHFGLDLPSLTGTPSPKSEKILIYGGSSSSGSIATSYAVAAGYQVVTTSSPRNRSFVSSLGPSAVIDHTQPQASIVRDLANHGPFHAVLDCIGSPSVTHVLSAYSATLPSSSAPLSYAALNPVSVDPSQLPAPVSATFSSWPSKLDEEGNESLRAWASSDLVTKGLAQDGIFPALPLKWIEGGLDKCQDALDLLYAGQVSAEKLVMDPWA